MDSSIWRLGYRIYDKIFGGRVFRQLDEVIHLYHSPDKLDGVMEARLKRLLRHATENVKFYSYLKPNTELADFPIINKSLIQESYGDFVMSGLSSADKIEAYTSGTHARPLVIISNREKIARKRAEAIFFNGMAGYELGMRFVYLRATPLNKIGARPEIRKLVQNEVIADVTDYSEHELMRVNQRLCRGDIKFIVAWPSVLKLLAEDALSRGVCCSAIKGIITTGEALLKPDKELIRCAFNCPVLNRYGCTEVGIVAFEEPGSDVLLVNRATVLVEVLRFDTNEPVKPGEAGRIIITGLYSEAMPFIRYDTGDVGVVNEMVGPYVKSLSSVDGRYMEKFIDTQGRYVIPMMLINCLPDSERTKLRQYQFVQEGAGMYALNAVPRDERIAKQLIVANMKNVLGEDAQIRINYVSQIPNLPSGKYGIMINTSNLNLGSSID